MKYQRTLAFTGTVLALLVLVAAPARAESVTPACPSTPITHALTVGSRDYGTAGDVSRLQVFLGISPTGYFGPITRAGVITFQSANGVAPAVGYVGPLTRAAIAGRCSPTPGNTIKVSFSAAPTVGSAPLAVTFSGAGSGLGSGQYVVDYGDGANSGPVPSYCTKPTSSATTSDCTLTAGHTYQTAGVYSASLSPYIACLWSSPRCELAAQLLGSANITVGSTAAANTLIIPGATTLTPGTSASASGAYFTYTLTLNSTSVAGVLANFTWSESHCGTSGCLGAADPAPQTFTLYLSGGTSTYTTALGHTLTLTAVAANSATVDLSR